MIQSGGDNREAVRRIIDYIHTKRLSAGDRLPSIRQLSALFSLGTNVVRDAMIQAQAMGLLQIHPRSGAFVRSLNYVPFVDALADTVKVALLKADHNLLHVLDARRRIETEMIAEAARWRRLEDLLPVREALEAMRRSQRCPPERVDADIRFHIGLARAAGNPVLVIILQALELLRPHLARLSGAETMWQRAERSHIAIYQAVVDQDGEAARQAMSDHLNLACENLLKEIQSPPHLDP